MRLQLALLRENGCILVSTHVEILLEFKGCVMI